MKKLLIITTLTLLFFLSACSSEQEPQIERANPSILAEDIPIPLGSTLDSSTSVDDLDSAVYIIQDSPENLRKYFNENIKEPWELELAWFKYGDGMQAKWQTEKFNPRPGFREGREIIVSVYPQDDNPSNSRVVILHTNYDN